MALLIVYLVALPLSAIIAAALYVAHSPHHVFHLLPSVATDPLNPSVAPLSIQQAGPQVQGGKTCTLSHKLQEKNPPVEPMSPHQPTLHSNLLALSDRYEAFICDAYGVFWDGAGLYPGVLETFAQLKRQGKRVVILSNSTQSSEKESDKYASYGLQPGQHYERLITSGDLAHDFFTSGHLPFPTPHRRFWVYADGHPKYSYAPIFEEAPFKQTDRLEEADFIYLAVPHLNGEDQTDPELFRPSLRQLVQYQLPAICANPDRWAQHGRPARFVVRQGSIAAIYQQEGGTVYYLGKPELAAYHAALEQLRLPLDQVLMVGDNVDTDIRGAHRAGIDSALVFSTGIACYQAAQLSYLELASQLEREQLPTHWLERLALPSAAR